MVWTQIKTDILSVLIWVQIVCKGYQQMTKVAVSKESSKVSLLAELRFQMFQRCVTQLILGNDPH